jgi:hypothetical protein
VDVDVSTVTTDQVICIHQILEEKMGVQWNSVSVILDFKKSYDSVRRVVLYNILNEFGIRMKLLRILKMCSSETYSNICTGKHVSCISYSE